ncbi:hypothetical protein ISCGN_008100 [Ixodes scapularis]
MPERLVSLIGLNRLDDLHVLEVLRLLALDFAVLFTSVATLLVSNRPVVDETTRPIPQRRWRVPSAVMGDFLVLLLMAGAGVLQASLSSLVYFAVFLGTATRLGMHLPLAKGYRLLRTCLMLYSAAHILVLYAYQLDYLQGLVPPSSLEARLIGLSPLRVAPCTGDDSALSDFRLLVFRRLHWTLYLSPLAVLGFYFVVATVTRYQLLQKTDHVTPPPRSPDLPDDVTGIRIVIVIITDDVISDVTDDLTGIRIVIVIITDDVTSDVTDDVTGIRIVIVIITDDVISDVTDDVTDIRIVIVIIADDGCRLLTRGSYMLTLIVMMAWSITYHSWLTFVLLIWSCVLWMMPSSRQACLRSSPALVAYAELLLLLQYLYSLDLTDKELPQHVNTVNLAQLGLIKYAHDSYQPLSLKAVHRGPVRPMVSTGTQTSTDDLRLPSRSPASSGAVPVTPLSNRKVDAASSASTSGQGLTSPAPPGPLAPKGRGLPPRTSAPQRKPGEPPKQSTSRGQLPAATDEPMDVLYTVMFWITLRQYFKLKRSPVEESIDLRRRGSTVTFSISTQLLVRRLGRLVQQWLTRYWIWVVASMLMFISLGGEQVVLYRIVYMLLFLFFVTVFQVSYQLWIKVMYGFWLTVIIYSMLVLILIYSYQFEHFPEYWEHHLRIPVGFQKDIGLEVYQADPGTLFLKLLTPTFFLIITIIQLHYFHNEFIKLNEDHFTYS